MLTDICSLKKYLFNNFSAVCFFSPSAEIKLDQQVVRSRRWKRIPFVTLSQPCNHIEISKWKFSLLFRVESRPYILKNISRNIKTLLAVFYTFLVAFSQVWLFLSLMVIEIILTGKHNQDRRYGMLKIKPKLHKRGKAHRLWQPVVHVNVKVEQD